VERRIVVGFFNINKPAGMTSAGVVSRVKRIIRERGVGHMGTLDPMATGVLPVAVGRAATKLFDKLQEKRKEYVAQFKFGVDTDTLDTTGAVLSECGRVPTAEEIKNVLPEFIGKISQVPPAYSAKSINGVRAYTLARRGEEVILKPKEIIVYDIQLNPSLRACEAIQKTEREFEQNCVVCVCNDAENISIQATAPVDDTFTFRITCGSGTYIRALARDIAARLNTVAAMSALVCTKSGMFTIEDAVTLEQLAESPEKWLIGVDKVLMNN